MLYGIISMAAGVALLLAAELAGLAAVRIAAFALLAGGIVGVGIAAGFKPQSVETLKRIAGIFSRTAVCVIAVILVTPMLMVLIESLVGAAAQLLNRNSVVNMPLVITGSVIVLLLLTISLTVTVIAICAIRGKVHSHPAEKQA